MEVVVAVAQAAFVIAVIVGLARTGGALSGAAVPLILLSVGNIAVTAGIFITTKKSLRMLEVQTIDNMLEENLARHAHLTGSGAAYEELDNHL